MEQQRTENTEAAPRQTGSMLERLWNSHPWQADMAESDNGKPKPTLGPPPSASAGKSTSRWGNPWRTQSTTVGSIPPEINDDEISLGESVGEDKTCVVKETVASKAPAPPVLKDNSNCSAAPAMAPAPAPAQEEEDEHAELLAIDFDRDGDALKEVIAEDVLAMWEEQGLYQDMPDIRDEILKGIVRTKFDALRNDQAKVLEKRQLEGMPKIAAGRSRRMSIIEEEEEESSDDDAGPALEEQAANMTDEERFALHAFQVQEELEIRLKDLDTSDHLCLEASGRWGMLPLKESEVAIKDANAFNKVKLHHALEKRVSKVFTDDHHVVVASSLDEKENSGTMDESFSSLPIFRAQENEFGIDKVRETLASSFSAFDAALKKKQPPLEEDEWTECEVVTLADHRIEGMEKTAAEMDRKVRLLRGAVVSDDESFMEFTVTEDVEVDVDELSQKNDNVSVDVDVDELSDRRDFEKVVDEEKQAVQHQKSTPWISSPQGENAPRPVNCVASTASCYGEITVEEEAVLDHSHLLYRATIPPDAHQHVPANHSSMNCLSRVFATITTSNVEDDDMTQLTFDQTVEGAISSPREYLNSNTYMNKTIASPKAVTPSPRNKCASLGGSQQTDPTRETVLMDESLNSLYERGTVDSPSRDAAAAMSKSVAKILRVEIWSPKPKVVASAMDRLAEASSYGTAQRANIARLGGIIAILRAMQSHPRHLQIQTSGCEALAQLSEDEDTQESITEVGGTGAVVTAMESHPDDVKVQQFACIALANITKIRDGQGGAPGMSDSEDEEDHPSSSGVLQALVAAMIKHPLDSEIQANAFCALANVCLENQGRLRELSETGGLTAMTMALQRPWASKMEQHEAISTLSILLRSLANLTTCDC